MTQESVKIGIGPDEYSDIFRTVGNVSADLAVTAILNRGT